MRCTHKWHPTLVFLPPQQSDVYFIVVCFAGPRDLFQSTSNDRRDAYFRKQAFHHYGRVPILSSPKSAWILKYRGHVSQVHTLDGGYKVYGSSVLSRLKIEYGVAVFIFLFIDKSQDTFDKIATTSTGSEIECGRPCDSDYTNIQGTNQHRFQETIPQSMHYVIKNTCLNLIVASHLKHHQ